MGLLSSIAITPTLIAMLSTGAGGTVEVEPPELPSQVSPHNYEDIESADSVSHESFSSNRSDTDSGFANSLKRIFSGDSSERAGGSSAVFSSLDRPQGIDISSHQHGFSSINLRKVMSDGGQSYAFIKATEGTHYINPNYRNDVVELINADIPVGFYHYAKPVKDIEEAKQEAQLFVSVTGIGKGVKSLPPVLDIEENKNNLSPSELVAWTEAFVNEVKALTGRDVMIYTYPTFWKTEMGNTTKFSNLPLWIAHYNNGNAPDVPGGWNDWVFWQFTSSGRVSGYDKDLDMNYFNGDENQLRAMYK